ncbi:MAG: hypothetical protein IKN14_02990 [Clostridiales bacterium]|nr:hypothetical protein [Clostridiales bacterium]
MENELTKEQIAAMAVACIAEETGEDMKNVRIISFRELKRSSLEQYIADNNIDYKKYELEDEMYE